MNKKIATEVALGIIIIIAIIFGAAVWLSGNQKVQTSAQTVKVSPIIKQEAQKQVPRENDASGRVGYKNLKVSDGLVAFSFEVPEKWLTETRHSGEKQLTTEEMRNFLATSYEGDIKTNPKLFSDYFDISWAELKKMNADEIKKIYFRSDDPWLPYANVSVAASSYISYGDTSWKQIDFYIMKNFDSLKTYFNDFKRGSNTKEATWSTEKVNELDADVVTFATDMDGKGNEIISKGGAGGKIYFIRINDGKDMLVINKQAKGDKQFEVDFKNIIQTLKLII